MPGTASHAERIDELEHQVIDLTDQRDRYKQLYLQMLELCRKLERGIIGQKREKLSVGDQQLTLQILGMLLGSKPEPPAEVEQVRAHQRAKPTGRKPLPENLPRVDIEVLPPEVQQQGLDNFEKIGEDICETVERRPASLVVLRTHKPKFVPRGRERNAETRVLQSPPPELPIERGLAGPGLLADTVVRRWQDHLPLHRLERIYGREGLWLPRSTVCGWHEELAKLARPLIEAMWEDALLAPYLCVDATGVLVQAKERCRAGHFFVVAAPERHVLFGYSPRHNSEAVDELLKSYRGYLVADAHTVYDHLYRSGKVTEVGCWAHTRRYFFKALGSDPEQARQGLAFIKALFQLEREWSTAPPEMRLKERKLRAGPIVDDFFAWCEAVAPRLLDETPMQKAVGYALNQQAALRRFLEDGRLPIHNNFSERQLRREALGRNNWLFIGSDEGGETNAVFVSLLASCQLHGLEPLGYLRDLFCLLPRWPRQRVLELSPAFWQQTLASEEVQRQLAANIYRQASLGQPLPHQITL